MAWGNSRLTEDEEQMKGDEKEKLGLIVRVKSLCLGGGIEIEEHSKGKFLELKRRELDEVVVAAAAAMESEEVAIFICRIEVGKWLNGDALILFVSIRLIRVLVVWEFCRKTI